MARFIDRLTLLNTKDLGTINTEGILRSGDLDEITECIEIGVNFPLSLLEIPIIRNNLDVFNLIMDSSSDYDLHRRPATNLEYVDKRTIGEKLLFAACRHNRFDMIKKLLDCGVDVNATDIDKETPLYAFIKYIPHSDNVALNYLGYSSYLEGVQELICRGANVNATSRYNSTPLCKAAYLGAVSIVEELIKNGAQSIMPISYAQTVDTTTQQEIDVLLKIPTAFKNKDWSTVTELLATNKNHIAIQRLYDMGYDSDLSLIIHYTQNALATIDGGLLHNLESQDNQQEESSILGQLVQYCTIL